MLLKSSLMFMIPNALLLMNWTFCKVIYWLEGIIDVKTKLLNVAKTN